ncbi:MAG: long-chain fatty acid--CoA ligase [Chloroflexi bacterium]|nr:long-chain fatty acid--CoA ligase [Chloroflexota bacterium]MDA1146027.1 long-chain fatty acid--CoA ligase [Chloroflexota bacterium]
MSLNLGTILQASAAERPDHPALIIGDQSFTYAQLDRAARGVATALLARGLQPGDHISIMIPNVPQFPVAYYGALYAGLAVVPLNVLLTAEEVAYHIEDSESKLLIGHTLFQDPAVGGGRAADVDVIWADGDDGKALMDLAASEPIDEVYPTPADSTAVILYTSGTTGRPKGAELSHSNLFMNCSMVVPRLFPLNHEDVALATLPLFHSFGQSVVLNATIAAGGTVVLLPRFTPQDVFELIQKHKITMFAGVPTMYFGLLHHPEGDKYDASSLKYALTGGAAMPVEVMNAFEARFPVKILEGYGLSETSPVASFNMLDRPRKVGSIGYPVWGVEMAILDENDQPVADGERGEICIRGHNIMTGYFKRAEANAETMKNGWFHSGDIGIKDPDGSYSIVDRVKDMIIRGGYNVYPREVEEVLYAHPAIVEAAVIGIPHEEYGEEVKAVIVLGAGHTLEAAEVIAYTKEHLAAYKYPRQVEFLDTLPKGPTGKILKRELR